MFTFFWYKKASRDINHPLCHSKPVVCCAGAFSCLSFLQLCFPFSLSFALPFPCFSLWCSISLFPPYTAPLPPSFSWFYPVSFLWPPGDLCPVIFLRRWPPVLCDFPQQMLPITVRNMPSISPLILKRLKVQFSLPPTCPLLSVLPVDANRHQPSPKPPQPSSAVML